MGLSAVSFEVFIREEKLWDWEFSRVAEVCLTRWVHVLAQLVAITLWETLLSCPLKNENSIVHSELLTIFEPNASVHTLFYLFFFFPYNFGAGRYYVFLD